MKYLVDAWLERCDPIIRLLDGVSGRTVAEWRGDEVRRLFAEGSLEMAGLTESVYRLAGLDGDAVPA